MKYEKEEYTTANPTTEDSLRKRSIANYNMSNARKTVSEVFTLLISLVLVRVVSCSSFVIVLLVL